MKITKILDNEVTCYLNNSELEEYGLNVNEDTVNNENLKDKAVQNFFDLTLAVRDEIAKEYGLPVQCVEYIDMTPEYNGATLRYSLNDSTAGAYSYLNQVLGEVTEYLSGSVEKLKQRLIFELVISFLSDTLSEDADKYFKPDFINIIKEYISKENIELYLTEELSSAKGYISGEIVKYINSDPAAKKRYNEAVKKQTKNMSDFSLPDLFAQNINNPFTDAPNDDSLTDKSEQTIKGFDTETDQVSEDENRLSDSVFDDNSDSLRKTLQYDKNSDESADSSNGSSKKTSTDDIYSNVLDNSFPIDSLYDSEFLRKMVSDPSSENEDDNLQSSDNIFDPDFNQNPDGNSGNNQNSDDNKNTDGSKKSILKPNNGQNAEGKADDDTSDITSNFKETFAKLRESIPDELLNEGDEDIRLIDYLDFLENIGDELGSEFNSSDSPLDKLEFMKNKMEELKESNYKKVVGGKFNSINDIEKALNRLNSWDKDRFSSSLYLTPKNKYIIILSATAPDISAFNSCVAGLMRDGTLIHSGKLQIPYIKEHCETLIENNAVEIIKGEM